uniref:Uncharacterized protein n=1 Tax=Oryza punctata TaxID=4537 RepID=A0A0E0LTN8_ORYPU
MVMEAFLMDLRPNGATCYYNLMRVESKESVTSDSEELRGWCRTKRMDRAATPPHFAVSMCPTVSRFAMAAG